MSTGRLKFLNGPVPLNEDSCVDLSSPVGFASGNEDAEADDLGGVAGVHLPRRMPLAEYRPN
jgi:hypothetical protein